MFGCDKGGVSGATYGFRMDEARVGRTIRAIRIRRGWRQLDLALAAHGSRDAVSRIERGRLDEVSVATLERLCRALDASLDIRIRWHGGDLDRLLNARHAALHEAFAQLAVHYPAWTLLPEVSFNVYGERGVIDVVLWHAERRVLVVVELKTELVDVSELVGSVDRKRRLGAASVRGRGWRPAAVGAWVVVAESRTNRRRVTAHRTMLRAAFPDGARAVDAWLHEPVAPMSALTFLTYARGDGVRQNLATVKRVRRRLRKGPGVSTSVSSGRQASAAGP